MSRLLHLWSGPRNVSTALMYAFARRDDTWVVDEPLYAHYLHVSGAVHPGREEVLAAQQNDGEQAARELLATAGAPLVFAKQMAHHLVGFDPGFLQEFLAAGEHLLLIRDPREVLMTLVHQIPQPTLADLGIARQAELFDQLAALGREPLVLDARELLLDPPGVLRTLCDRLGLSWQEAMLSWPTGPRPEDGVWARHWYHNVHRSTGFAPYRPKQGAPPPGTEEVLAAARPHYETLLAHALRAPLGSSGRATSAEAR